MALTEHDKKTLSASDQKKIQNATNKWNAANAKGDKAGMKAAADEAAAIRNKAGYQTDSWGRYTGSYSGGGSSKGSSGGGGSTKNSQYSAPVLGSTWDANTDYQSIINDAVANGDYMTAAKAEQLRNQKITSSGLNYPITNKYGGTLDGIDYGIVGQNQMANGASWQDVLATYNSRYNKAAYSGDLRQYANDDIQNMMNQYILEGMKESNQKESQDMYDGWQSDYEEANPRDDYNSKYASRIDKKLAEILNRDEFSYDVKNDPLYEVYAEMYRREGDRAMRDTLAEVAAGAGGMNSYAVTAAQQANNYYNSQLNDVVPELYQIAYQKYLNELEGKVQDLGILEDMDATQYGRYRDTINDWYADKQFAYGLYKDAVDQGNYQTSLDYNVMMNDRNMMYDDLWRNKEFDAYQEEINYNKSQNEKESAQAEVWGLIELGVPPSPELIAKAGMSETEVALAIESVRAQMLAKGIAVPTSSSIYGGNSILTRSAPDSSEAPANEAESEDAIYAPTTYNEFIKSLEDGTARKINYKWPKETPVAETASTSTPTSTKPKQSVNDTSDYRTTEKTSTPELSSKSSFMVLPTVDEDLDDIYATQGKEVANKALDEALVTGVITTSDYMKLKSKYRE